MSFVNKVQYPRCLARWSQLDDVYSQTSIDSAVDLSSFTSHSTKPLTGFVRAMLESSAPARVNRIFPIGIVGRNEFLSLTRMALSKYVMVVF